LQFAGNQLAMNQLLTALVVANKLAHFCAVSVVPLPKTGLGICRQAVFTIISSESYTVFVGRFTVTAVHGVFEIVEKSSFDDLRSEKIVKISILIDMRKTFSRQ
jgi:hypothetical protein